MAFSHFEPGKTVFERSFGSGLDSPKAYYNDLGKIAGRDEPLGPPIDYTEEDFWKRIEADRPGVVERVFERLFGIRDSDSPATFEEEDYAERLQSNDGAGNN